ncbi:helix-turn-helix domain-containing protein [Nocardia cyriacigeorgica]|uniref:helix-turn-helix domain-containing protein n=1 Tax=Nocardia cyriacigeorgica TaxID=135487 RepID=UPI00138AFCB4|nr:helix-turn-helix domain-containing protein [Nocardia cyriacigeorgica]
MTDDPDIFIGQRVRQIRARRGITQQVLADRVGISRSVIAMYEAGLRPVDSRRTLLALAAALGVTIGDLTGHEQERLDPSAAGFHSSVPDIEIALWSAGNVTHTAPPRTLDELSTAAQRAAELRIACDYAALGPMLAPMLTDCSGSPPRREAPRSCVIPRSDRPTSSCGACRRPWNGASRARYSPSRRAFRRTTYPRKGDARSTSWKSAARMR